MGKLKRINPAYSNIDYAKLISEKLVNSNKDEDKITNNKLRTLFSLLNKIYNKVYSRNISSLDDILSDLEYLKIRFAYESGREEAVKNFINNESKLSDLLEEVIQDGTMDCFFDYCRYFEAYVAFIKYFEGVKNKCTQKS